MRSLQVRLSGIRVHWLIGGLILANLAGQVYFILRAEGSVWVFDPISILGHAIGAVWMLGLIGLGPWIVQYIGVGEGARTQFTGAALALTGLFVVGGLRGAVSAEVFAGVPLSFLYLYPRATWSLIGLAMLSSGMVAMGKEVRRLRYERDNLQVVLAFSESVSLMGKDGVLRETVSTIRRLTEADACLLFLVDPEADVLRVAHHFHNEAVYTPGYVERMINFPCPRGFGLTGRVLETGEPYLSSSVEKDPRAKAPPGEKQHDKTVLILPMKVQGRLIGVLRVSKMGVDQFTDAQVTVCAILANHAAVAMDAGNLYHEVLKASRTDHLTGLGNARAFRESLQQAVVARKPFSLLMVDADCLKHVNDTFGHHAGDELLMALAEHLRMGADGLGTAYRYAGDEFLVLLPGVDQDIARAVAERVRKGLAEMQTINAAAGMYTTVSIGVAGFPADGDDAESVLKAADKAMYCAKQGGKNQVQLAS